MKCMPAGWHLCVKGEEWDNGSRAYKECKKTGKLDQQSKWIVWSAIIAGILLLTVLICSVWLPESRKHSVQNRKRIPHLVMWDQQDVMYVDSVENEVLANRYDLMYVREDVLYHWTRRIF